MLDLDARVLARHRQMHRHLERPAQRRLEPVHDDAEIKPRHYAADPERFKPLLPIIPVPD
ncbi:MAG: hypothetical protein OTI36_06660 [Beijerinckiaceae bacterium]|nr:hypothetical protein [Beijerinckiaceae bacterium]